MKEGAGSVLMRPWFVTMTERRTGELVMTSVLGVRPNQDPIHALIQPARAELVPEGA